MCDDFRLRAFERYLHFKTTFDFALMVFLFANVAVIKYFREILLCSADYPDTIMTYLREICDDFLKRSLLMNCDTSSASIINL